MVHDCITHRGGKNIFILLHKYYSKYSISDKEDDFLSIFKSRYFNLSLLFPTDKCNFNIAISEIKALSHKCIEYSEVEFHTVQILNEFFFMKVNEVVKSKPYFKPDKSNIQQIEVAN
jgi:hypothetical protein